MDTENTTETTNDVFGYEDLALECAEKSVETIPVEGRFEKIERIKGDLLAILTTIDPENDNHVLSYTATAAKPQRHVKADDVIMGTGEAYVDRRTGKEMCPFVGADEKTFTKVEAKSLMEKINTEAGPNVTLLTEADLDNNLKDVTHIRCLSPSPLSIPVGTVSTIRTGDLVETGKDGEYYVMSSKVVNQGDTSCIILDHLNGINSIRRLNDTLKLSLSNSATFRSFVNLGLVAISNSEEAINMTNNCKREFEEKKKLEEEQNLRNKTIIELPELLMRILDEVRRIGSMNVYEEAVADFESSKGEEVTTQEQFIIASDIICIARQAEMDKMREQTERDQMRERSSTPVDITDVGLEVPEGRINL